MTDDDNDDVRTVTNDLDMNVWQKDATDDNGTSHTYNYSKQDGTDSLSITVDDQIDSTGM